VPVSQKPRKARSPVQKLRPLNLRDELKCELPVQMAVTALGSGHFSHKQLAELIIHGEIVAAAGKVLNHPEASALGTEIEMISREVVERYNRTKAWGVSGPELLRLREITAATIAWVRTVPNHIIYRIVTTNRKKRGLK
jgi:hypothetical protein